MSSIRSFHVSAGSGLLMSLLLGERPFTVKHDANNRLPEPKIKCIYIAAPEKELRTGPLELWADDQGDVESGVLSRRVRKNRRPRRPSAAPATGVGGPPPPPP